MNLTAPPFIPFISRHHIVFVSPIYHICSTPLDDKSFVHWSLWKSFCMFHACFVLMSPSDWKQQQLLSLACYQINQIDHILVGHDASPLLETSSSPHENLSLVSPGLPFFSVSYCVDFFCVDLSDRQSVILFHFISQNNSPLLVLMVCRLKVLKYWVCQESKAVL